VRGCRCADGGRDRPRGETLDVFVPHASARPAAGHLPQVDAAIARVAAHRRRCERPVDDRGRLRRGAASCSLRFGRRRRVRARRPCHPSRTGRRCRSCRHIDPSRRCITSRLDPDQLRAHREHLPCFARERHHRARQRRRYLHARLVGHHDRQRLVFGDRVARLHQPLDQLDFGDALADVGHLDRAGGHAQASIARRIAAPTRFGPGK